ncbi:P-loop containing nucleoside triphosphate hydrolase protein [Armillaria gallica]|uniref:P-loop containing nucleoside triphosphate hydrolase protein n=1 Tax=Armillaria gallica TaxID=47427 RepID=A0A2H3CY77_ARMGA|nr:P-loop containing nucleoside triphosphate hydrolase protein [Armillaria gallica]
MSLKLSWKDSEGLQAIRNVVAKQIPHWKNRLWPFQELPIVLILNGEDVLLCTVTGDGKSALFTIPILYHLELEQSPSSYPSLTVQKHPIGLVIIPTKGLASNIVTQLTEYGISALSYCHKTITEYNKTGRDLTNEIATCESYQVICIDPKHILGLAWMKITNSDVFCKNIIFACIEEVHLKDEWGSSFRPAFKHIGTFLRGRLPSHISVFALFAMLQPGSSTILSFISSECKAIIHCPSIKLIYQVYLYLWHMEPSGIHCVQMYHSLNSNEYNMATLDLLDSNPQLLIVIASVAFTNGINVKSLLNSISLTFPKTLDQAWQQEGHIGRVLEDLCHGIMLVQRSDITKAEKFIAGESLHLVLPPIYLG